MTANRHGNAKTFSSRIIGLVVGLAAAALGLLPWLRTGARLPLQNLSADAPQLSELSQNGDLDLDAFMPFSLLPLSQYTVVETAAWLVMGGVIAGLAIWLFRSRLAIDPWLTSVGLLAGHLIVAVQAFTALQSVLPSVETGTARSYFLALLAGVAASAILAQLLFWSLASGSKAARLTGVVLSSIPLGNWIVGIVSRLFPTQESFSLGGGASGLGWIGPVIPAIIVGLALGFMGISPAKRLTLWFVGFIYLWLVPAALTAVQYGLGSRVLLKQPRELVDASLQVFTMALGPAGQGLRLVLTALVVGAVIALLLHLGAKAKPRTK